MYSGNIYTLVEGYSHLINSIMIQSIITIILLLWKWFTCTSVQENKNYDMYNYTRPLLLQTEYCSNLSALSLVKNVPTVLGRFLTPKLNIPISMKAQKLLQPFG